MRPLQVASLAVVAASIALLIGVVKPLQERARVLENELLASARPAGELKRVSFDTPASKLGAFYAQIERRESADEWLAKLYSLAAASGLELRTAQYRLAESRHRIERYEISLPVQGTYSQVRRFLDSALAEIPVLSLDRASFRRKAGEARVEADIVVTLHLLGK